MFSVVVMCMAERGEEDRCIGCDVKFLEKENVFDVISVFLYSEFGRRVSEWSVGEFWTLCHFWLGRRRQRRAKVEGARAH